MTDNTNAALGIPSGNPSKGEASSSSGNTGEETPMQFCQRIRGQTCYSTLRLFATIVLRASQFFFILAAIVGTLAAFMKGGALVGVLSLLLLAFFCAVGWFFAVVFYQLVSLQIDIADTLIEQNRKKHILLGAQSPPGPPVAAKKPLPKGCVSALRGLLIAAIIVIGVIVVCFIAGR